MPVINNTAKKILCCTDFSNNAALAFKLALEAASQHPKSILYLLHVIPEPESQFWRTYIYGADFDVDEKAKKDLDTKVAQEYLPLLPEGIDFRMEYRIGKDYQKILETAENLEVDLLVMGRQGRSQLHNLFFGKVAERVAGRAKCPVLVVPLKK